MTPSEAVERVTSEITRPSKAIPDEVVQALGLLRDLVDAAPLFQVETRPAPDHGHDYGGWGRVLETHSLTEARQRAVEEYRRGWTLVHILVEWRT